MSPKSQFKFQIEDDFRERLNTAAKRHGRDTAQEVVEEILTIYFPVWLAVADSARRAIDYQTQKLLERGALGIRKVNGELEPVPDSQVVYVRHLGELTDERKHKPVRKKAGSK
jgi:hypothetical protein